MSVKREYRENKEVKTRPLKQQIENLKLDKLDLEDNIQVLEEKIKFVTESLELALNTKGNKRKLKIAYMLECLKN